MFSPGAQRPKGAVFIGIWNLWRVVKRLVIPGGRRAEVGAGPPES